MRIGIRIARPDDYGSIAPMVNGCSVLHLEASRGGRLKFYEKNGFKICNSGLYRWLYT